MHPRDPAALPLLRDGEIEVAGRLVEASNATLLCTIAVDGVSADCVYKPIRGERPLWDFPDGTLADREVATYLISEATGWDLVPPTVYRSGPFGPGMVQLWVDTQEDSELVDVVAVDAVPAGWRRVLRAHDQFGDPAVLVHADCVDLRRLAMLDAIANNADRKAGHVLVGEDDAVYAVDHGICLHHEDKLRTVLWGFLGEPISGECLEVIRGLRARLESGMAECLSDHLTRKEILALRDRMDQLLVTETYPAPSGEWRAIPWPPF